MAADPGQLRIGEFARRVGVTPKLLRAWKSRYGLTRPVRSPGGFRRSRPPTQLACGACAVSSARGSQRLRLRAPHVKTSGRPEGLLKDAAGRLLESIRRYDEAAVDSVLDESLAAFGLEQVLRDVVLPTVKQVGDGSERGEIEISHEHFASNLIPEQPHRRQAARVARFWGRGTGP